MTPTLPANTESPVPESPLPDGDERDAVLLQRIAAGDRAAFQALYERYFGRLRRFLARTSRRPEVVDDAVNDAFWVVWQKAADFRGCSRVSTWIFGIAYRCALKALRSNPAGPAPAVVREEAAHEPAIEQERAEWVGRGLAQLCLEQRITLELAYYLGHSCEEIAQIMDCSVGTVKARMFHARVKLRNVLPELGGYTRGEP